MLLMASHIGALRFLSKKKKPRVPAVAGLIGSGRGSRGYSAMTKNKTSNFQLVTSLRCDSFTKAVEEVLSSLEHGFLCAIEVEDCDAPGSLWRIDVWQPVDDPIIPF